MGLIDYLRDKFPPNRVVAFLTPIIFAPLAGTISAWLAEKAPLIHANLSADQLTAIFIAGALTALGAAYKWLDGWQKHELATKLALQPTGGGGLEPLGGPGAPTALSEPLIGNVSVEGDVRVEGEPEDDPDGGDDLRRARADKPPEPMPGPPDPPKPPDHRPVA